MALKQRTDGSYIISNRGEADQAAELLRETQRAVDEMNIAFMSQPGVREAMQDAVNLRKSIDGFLLANKYSIDIDGLKMTPTYPKERKWNVDKLREVLPAGLFKRVIVETVDSDKLDELVKAGKVKLDAIEPAYEESPKTPSVRITWAKGTDKAKTETEASSLEKKLSRRKASG